MEISSTEGSPFRNTFRPIEPKKAKKIKISVPKDLPREEEMSSPEVVEIDYRGYKIRNAPEIKQSKSKRKSRWDADQNNFSVPNTKEILEKQGKFWCKHKRWTNDYFCNLVSWHFWDGVSKFAF